MFWDFHTACINFHEGGDDSGVVYAWELFRGKAAQGQAASHCSAVSGTPTFPSIMPSEGAQNGPCGRQFSPMLALCLGSMPFEAHLQWDNI